MIDKSKLSDFQVWREANSNDFSLLDYIRGNLATGQVAPDLIIALFSLLFPAFVEVDGMVFLEEQFSEEKLVEIRRGRVDKEIEYWMNLLSLGSLFDALPGPYIPEIATKIKQCWSNQLMEMFPQKRFEVSVHEDDGDVFVVFSQRE